MFIRIWAWGAGPGQRSANHPPPSAAPPFSRQSQPFPYALALALAAAERRTPSQPGPQEPCACALERRPRRREWGGCRKYDLRPRTRRFHPGSRRSSGCFRQGFLRRFFPATFWSSVSCHLPRVPSPLLPLPFLVSYLPGRRARELDRNPEPEPGLPIPRGHYHLWLWRKLGPSAPGRPCSGSGAPGLAVPVDSPA